MTHDRYLNIRRKRIYMNDFRILLKCEIDFWRLDQGLKDILTNINSNEYIQTIYSKRHNLNNFTDQVSYLKFCYYKEVELYLFRFILPDFVYTYNCKPNTFLYYAFSLPSKNDNFIGHSNKLGLGCTDNKDYLNINHLVIYMDSPDLDTHNTFWNDLEAKLTYLKPK